MSLLLEVITGVDQGRKFRVQEGARMGRAACDILVNDKRVSAFHAQIEKNEKGDLVLVDAESSNGLIINGRRVRRVLMRPGVLFQAGDSTFKVVHGEIKTFEALLGIAPPKDVEAEGSELVTYQEPEPTHWADVLKKYLEPSILGISPKPNKKVKQVKPVLNLNFIQGIQTNTTWFVGWGPRSIGRETLEYRLLDPGAPNLAFEIVPNEWGEPIFRTDNSKAVLLNGKSISEGLLQPGDIIGIGDTLIQITTNQRVKE